MRKTLFHRASGLLLHPSSLVNAYPIGDIGPAAHEFVDFLARAGQQWWQMLPINPTGDGNSPYKSFSSFAANTLLISPDSLAEAGWLKKVQLPAYFRDTKQKVQYPAALLLKQRCLGDAFIQFEASSRPRDREALNRFVHDQRSWLPDFALFMALRTLFGEKPWWAWDRDIRKRHPEAIKQAQDVLKRDILFYEFGQWQFALQWEALRRHATRKNVGFIGDLPIFVSPDSADAWAHPDLFMLKPDGSPALVAGVPPDYFSKTGQLWGNPHYRWAAMKKDGYQWWGNRLKTILHYFDAVRIDHFIGFVRYYEIPAEAKTAEHGRYRPGPGGDFIRKIQKLLGSDRQKSLILEDLGTVTPEVKQLRDTFSLPGMKVLQFAFGDDPEARSYQPHNYLPNCVVYTGTHDNNTTVGWYREEASTKEKQFAHRYLPSNGRELHWDMIRAALASPGNTVIIPAQDILGLGSKHRMNYPGTGTGNWEWRLKPGTLSKSISQRLRELSETYQRTL